MAKQPAQKHEATITVTKTNFYMGKAVATKEKVEKIQVRAFATEPAKVRVAFNRKLNMGNFESFGIDIGGDIPCYLEEFREVLPQVIEFVKDRLALEVKQAGGKSLDVDLNELDR